MKNIKTLTPIISAILILALFAACGGEAKIRDDVAVSDIAESISSVLGNDDLVSVPETFISGSMKMDVSDFDSYDVRINSKGINIDEVGIFKATDSAQVETIQKAINDYLQMRKDTWMDEYMPEEKPKLESAEVETLGNYVIYVILSDKDKSSVIDAFEKSLQG